MSKHEKRRDEVTPAQQGLLGALALAAGVVLEVLVLRWFRARTPADEEEPEPPVHRRPRRGGVSPVILPGENAPRAQVAAAPEGWAQREPALRRALRLGFEPRDANVGCVVGAGVLLIICAGLGLVATSVFQYQWVGHLPTFGPPPISNANQPAVPLPQVPPVLMSVPGQDMQQLRSEEDARLYSYGWVDQGAGIVHIPITTAMQLLLQQGLPTRAGTPVPNEGNLLPSRSSSGRTSEEIVP